LGRVDVSLIYASLDLDMRFPDVLPLKGEDLARSHSAEDRQLRDQTLAEIEAVEQRSHLLRIHDGLRSRRCLPRGMQEGCRVAVDVAFGLGQLEELVEIPAKVGDHTEREPFGALLVQEGLQLIAREAVQG